MDIVYEFLREQVKEKGVVDMIMEMKNQMEKADEIKEQQKNNLWGKTTVFNMNGKYYIQLTNIHLINLGLGDAMLPWEHNVIFYNIISDFECFDHLSKKDIYDVWDYTKTLSIDINIL